MYYVSEVTENSQRCQKPTLEYHLVMAKVTPNSSKIVHSEFKTHILILDFNLFT